MSARKFKIIESSTVEREYGLIGNEVILDHPDHGRLLVTDGYGGVDTMSGGCIRWRHGLVAQLQPNDCLLGLRAKTWNESTSTLQAVLNGYDSSRPLLNWPGYVIERMMTQIEGRQS